MNEKQLQLLEQKWANITFKRKDGTTKETVGTRNSDLIKEVSGYCPSEWKQRGAAEPYFDKIDNQVKSFVGGNLIELSE